MRRRGLIAAAVAVLAIAVSAAAAAAFGVYAGPGHTSSTDRARAEADAARQLAAIRLPAGAASSAIEPAGGGSELARPATYPATPNLIDRHRWWIIPGDPGSVLAFVEAHPPAGSKQDGEGSATGPAMPDLAFASFAWPATDNVVGSREMVVEVVALAGGRTGLRADAEDVWETLRDRSERIPPGATSLTVTVSRAGAVTQGPFHFISRARIDAARAIINSLPAAQPGVSSCPADPGFDVRLTFANAHQQPVAVADIDPGGCGGVSLSLDGAERPRLGNGGPHERRTLTARVDAALALHLNTEPPR